MMVCVCLFAVSVGVSEIELEPLVVLLRSRDSQVQRAASLALSNFAINGPGTCHSVS